MAGMAGKGKLITVIADRDTCTGFLLGGIGEINAKRQKNFLVVNKDTTIHEIEEAFRDFAGRKDVAIILITQKVAEEIRHQIDQHLQPIPAVLEIPSKDFPYDASKDSILKRAKLEKMNVAETFAIFASGVQFVTVCLAKINPKLKFAKGMFSSDDMR